MDGKKYWKKSYIYIGLFLFAVIILLWWYIPSTHILIDKNIDTLQFLNCIRDQDWDFTRALLNEKHKDTKMILLQSKERIINRKFLKQYAPIWKFLHKFAKERNGTLFGISIIWLPAGGTIYPHIDGVRNGVRSFNYYLDKDRFHLVLQGSYKYKVGSHSKIFSQGEIWWFDNKQMHSAKCLSDRIVVVFDLKKKNKS